MGGVAWADPLQNGWFTDFSGKYARLYTNTTDQLAGISRTTWSRGALTQALPAYSGVQGVYSSASWVYIRTSGLGVHIMGPWYLNFAKTANALFPNLPVNKNVLYRIPRVPTVPGSKTLTGLGAIGYFVDGVAMFDGRDGNYWNGTTEVGGMGTGYWNRDAYTNEGVTFDPALAHQPGDGTYHYHANPIALRYLLGDHVDYNAGTKTYAESTNAVTGHSPLLGWVRDGYPIYGPYGYSVSNNAASGVRRMISGYQLRNGVNGTDNLTATTNRSTIPAWAQRAYSTGASHGGPIVSTNYPLARYMEDYAFLGDLAGHTNGVDYDLDEYNGRWCVTPEFTNLTYVYFVSVSASGAPVFPFNIGRSFYGNPAGAVVGAITESVITNFIGGASNAVEVTGIDTNATDDEIALVWSSVDGGTYVIESATNLAGSWQNVATNVATGGTTTRAVLSVSGDSKFYRVGRSGVAAYSF